MDSVNYPKRQRGKEAKRPRGNATKTEAGRARAPAGLPDQRGKIQRPELPQEAKNVGKERKNRAQSSQMMAGTTP